MTWVFAILTIIFFGIILSAVWASLRTDLGPYDDYIPPVQAEEDTHAESR